MNNNKNVKIFLSLVCVFVLTIMFSVSVRGVTYKTGEAYIGEDANNPNWVWDIKSSSSKNSDTSISIKNDFVWDDSEDNPLGVGECLNLPNNYLSICFESLEPKSDDYNTYTFEYTNSADLDNAIGVTSAEAIEISTTDSTGLTILGKNIIKNGEQPDYITTNKIWLSTYNKIGKVDIAELYIYYKDIDDEKVYLAGAVKGDRDQYPILINSSIILAVENYNNIIYLKIIMLASQDYSDEFYNSINLYPTYNLTMNWVTVNNVISRLGNYVDLAEADELTYTGGQNGLVNLGTKDEDHREEYGIIIKNPKAYGDSDKVVLSIPSYRVRGTLVVKKDSQIIKGLPKRIGQNFLSYELPEYKIFVNELENLHFDTMFTSKYLKLATSLTSADDDYGSDVFLEVSKSVIYYTKNITFDETDSINSGKPLTISFLGKDLTITQITEDSINVGRLAICGNGIVESSEQCENISTNYFYSKEIISSTKNKCAYWFTEPWNKGFTGCTSECKLDLTVCDKPVYGDGLINRNEQCDKSFDGKVIYSDEIIRTTKNKCAYWFTEPWNKGLVACANGKIDLTVCDKPVYGDGLINRNEQCDYLNNNIIYADSLKIRNCADVGYTFDRAMELKLPCIIPGKINTTLCEGEHRQAWLIQLPQLSIMQKFAMAVTNVVTSVVGGVQGVFTDDESKDLINSEVGTDAGTGTSISGTQTSTTSQVSTTLREGAQRLTVGKEILLYDNKHKVKLAGMSNDTADLEVIRIIDNSIRNNLPTVKKAGDKATAQDVVDGKIINLACVEITGISTSAQTVDVIATSGACASNLATGAVTSDFKVTKKIVDKVGLKF